DAHERAARTLGCTVQQVQGDAVQSGFDADAERRRMMVTVEVHWDGCLTAHLACGDLQRRKQPVLVEGHAAQLIGDAPRYLSDAPKRAQRFNEHRSLAALLREPVAEGLQVR